MATSTSSSFPNIFQNSCNRSFAVFFGRQLRFFLGAAAEGLSLFNILTVRDSPVMLTRIPNAAIPCTITPLLVASSSADKLPIKNGG
ncbi:MAG: hypothetical protein AB1545_13640 [Thermodesulfobacteriota bacterium]